MSASALATPAISVRGTIPDIFVTRSTAAEVLSTNAKRIAILAQQGRLRTRQAPGGRVRYSLRDVFTLVQVS
jgi:hypothetical protein